MNYLQNSLEVVSSEDHLLKASKPSRQFYELETLRPKSPLPVKHKSKRWSIVSWGLRYFLIVFLVGAAFAVPIILFYNDRGQDDSTIISDESDNSDTDKAEETRNLVFYLCMWLLITWVAGCVTDMFILHFPYFFRFVAGFVNPSHQRYWRIFRVLRMPITILRCTIASYGSFQHFVNFNPSLLVNALHKDPGSWGWDDTINDVLEQCIFWAFGYVLEKLLVLYITVHYHYRSDEVKNIHSKDMHAALVTLYEASIYLHPIGSRYFVEEDKIIRNAFGSDSDSKIRAGASDFLRKIGIDGRKFAQFLGNFAQNEKTHWLQADSPYSVVERCLNHPKSAAALAKRMWVSLVAQGRQSFLAEDIAEVLGPYRRKEATQIFKIIDENESGDIRLDEMVWTVVEAGRIRHAIYQNMHDINHCINTFEWISLFVLAFVMIYFILIGYVDTLSAIKETIQYLVLGLTVGAGRVIIKYLLGCVFVFFEHPFDIGDRVNIYNVSGTSPVACVVTRLSLLYTIFRRIDNGTDLQIANERLVNTEIENVSRSGVNRQAFTIFIDFKTSFTDMKFLRNELETFLKENRRDYEPTLGLSVICVHELNKLELAVSFTHKSNWSNERLRAVRSSKFMCALLVAVRKIPINMPGGSGPSIGEEGKPMYTVRVTDDEAAAKAAADKKNRADARIGAIKVEEQVVTDEAAAQRAKDKADKEIAEAEAEEIALIQLTNVPVVESHEHDKAEAVSTGVETLIHNVSTGLRVKTASGPAGMFF